MGWIRQRIKRNWNALKRLNRMTSPWNTPSGRWLQGQPIFDDRRGPLSDYGIISRRNYQRFAKPFFRDFGKNANRAFWRPIHDASGAVGWIPGIAEKYVQHALPSYYQYSNGNGYKKRYRNGYRDMDYDESRIRQESFNYGKEVGEYFGKLSGNDYGKDNDGGYAPRRYGKYYTKRKQKYRRWNNRYQSFSKTRWHRY